MRNTLLGAVMVALGVMARPAGALPLAEPATRSPTPDTEADTTQAAPEAASQAVPAGSDADSAVGAAIATVPSRAVPRNGGMAQLPVQLQADRVDGFTTGLITASGHAELHQDGLTVLADELRYAVPDERCYASGNVQVDRGVDRITGPSADFNLKDQSGSIQEPNLQFGTGPSRPRAARASASLVTFSDANHEHLEQAAYTTCTAGQDDWFLTGSTVDMDRITQVGVAQNARILFEGVPLLYSPYMSFPLNDQRKSGFLAPTLGTTATNGVDVSLPYYFNLAPNRDDTLTTRLMSKRGLQLGNEFRYLEPDYHGTLSAELIDRDIQAGQRRYFLGGLHEEVLPGNIQLRANAQEVSDSNYFRDLSTAIGATSTTYLARDFSLSAQEGPWGLGARALSFQTIRDPVLPVVDQYRERPQLTANYGNEWMGARLSMQNEFTDFRHPTSVQGQRYVSYPSVSFPLEADWGYVTPKIGYHFTSYQLDREVLPGAGTHLTRTLPISSIDSGLYFDRSTELAGQPLLQTLEPRLYYVNIPYRNQDALPLFNTAVTDFSYSQLFAENQFSGSDRINDASQLTAAVQSRLIDPATGMEKVSALIGQRFYYRAQGVTIPGALVRTDNVSDVVSGLTGRVSNTLSGDFAWDYNPGLRRTEKLGVNAHYFPEPGRAINIGYRINRDTPGQPDIRQIDFSAEWPLWGRWSGVFRANYDTAQSILVEGLAGAEYNAGCWTLRVVTHRLAVSAVQTTSALFIQLELNGLVKLGTNPLEALRLNIPGYTKINEINP